MSHTVIRYKTPVVQDSGLDEFKDNIDESINDDWIS